MNRPFRLGSTSYVYPDDLVANVRRLGSLVDDVEFVLFETDGYGCNFPTAAEARELALLAAEHGLTYTIHLPMDVCPGDGSMEKARRAIDATLGLHPFAVILHFDGRAITGNPSPEAIAAWQSEAQEALQTVISWVGDPRLICTENLEGWSPRLFDSLVAESGVCRCIDIGHLWLEGADPLPYLDEHLAATRVVHLHGIGERDHSSLALMNECRVAAVMEKLITSAYAGVVTLEVFGEEDFYSSLRALEAAVDTGVC